MSNKVRLNLALSKDIVARLEEIRDETGAESITEVVRRALAVYDRLIEIREADSKVVIIKNGKETELLLTP